MNRLALIVFLISIFSAAANAQKLPSVQQVSVRAPGNIKIDGKANEWKFMACNKVTDIYYTIANDDERLYLIVQVRKSDIIEKVTKGGITLTIRKPGSKSAKINPEITFPMFDRDARNFVISTNKPELTTDPIKNKLHMDSIRQAKNKVLTDNIKAIGVMGIKEVTDSVISVYNEVGIKAAALFDDQLYYISELSVPLKYIGMDFKNISKFKYNIRLNGVAVNGTNLHTVETSQGNRLVWTGSDGVDYSTGLSIMDTMAQVYPTDFWGEYTLVKK